LTSAKGSCGQMGRCTYSTTPPDGADEWDTYVEQGTAPAR
jgi:hypothetical protein